MMMDRCLTACRSKVSLSGLCKVERSSFKKVLDAGHRFSGFEDALGRLLENTTPYSGAIWRYYPP